MQFVLRKKVLRDSFFNLYGTEFHVLTPENLIERCRRVVANCGKKRSLHSDVRVE